MVILSVAFLPVNLTSAFDSDYKSPVSGVWCEYLVTREVRCQQLLRKASKRYISCVGSCHLRSTWPGLAMNTFCS